MLRVLLLGLIVTLSATTGMAQEYVVRLGDRLQITVLEDPGLNTNALVRPDGRITMPLAGTVTAAGLTPEAVAQSIRSRLAAEFVSPPNVTVAVVGLGDPGNQAAAGPGAASVYVLGQIGRPGIYNIVLPLDALRLLALAGGPGNFAAQSRIQIRRQGEDGQETVILFDYEAVQDGVVPIERVALQDGDIIVVPERRLFE